MTTKGLDISPIDSSWGFKGKNYLFIIGIDKYQYWPPLQCAVNDVEDFARILTERYQFEKKDVIALKDKEATEKNILSGFKQLVPIITDQDNLVIYYSGHGHYDEVTKTGFWIPVNAHLSEESEYEYINTAVVVDRLKAINSLHTFLIIDACFSGTLITKIRASPRSERYKSRRVFTSGRAEVVIDGPEGGNSPFARGILNELTQNTDKHISASRLILDVIEYVEKEAQQTPLDARLMNADDQGGDFVFHLKMSEAEIWASVVRQHTKEAYKKFIEQFPQSEHHAEARETYDWLIAYEDPSIQSLQAYLNKYQPKGKYVPQAIKSLEAIEEEQCWKKAKSKNTLSAYFDYLYRYPEGQYIEEAKIKTSQIEGDEDDKEFKKAIVINTPEAYQEYLKKSADRKKYIDQAEKKSIPDSPLTEPPDEEKAWEKAKKSGTYIAYLNFTQAYPESRFAEEARLEMKRLDDIALNEIHLIEYNSNIPLQEKIKQCINYFNTFPGAGNNKLVKQTKDRLVIRQYSLGK